MCTFVYTCPLVGQNLPSLRSETPLNWQSCYHWEWVVMLNRGPIRCIPGLCVLEPKLGHDLNKYCRSVILWLWKRAREDLTENRQGFWLAIIVEHKAVRRCGPHAGSWTGKGTMGSWYQCPVSCKGQSLHLSPVTLSELCFLPCSICDLVML